jgi:hypothetical protein
MNYKAIIVCIVTLLTQLTSCQKKMGDYKTEKIDWLAHSTAPEDYPVTILSPNEFTSNKGANSSLIPNMEYLHSGWAGAAGSISGSPQPMPDRLNICWFSEAENKIYQGEFAMPQEKLYKIFKEGYMIFGINHEKGAKTGDYGPDLHKETYNSLTVGIAPKGMVVVWAVGQNRIEIGRFQAKELSREAANEVFKRHFKESGNMPESIAKEEFVRLTPKVQEEIKQGTISSKQFDDYRLRYNWKVVFNKPVSIYEYYIRYFNSEMDGNVPPDMLQETFNKKILEPTSKVVPRKFGIYITAQNGKDYLVRLETLDEQETIEAFKSLEAASPKSEIALFIDINDDFNAFKVILKNDKKELLLEKDTLKLFTIDRKNERNNKKIFESLPKK